MKKKRIVIAISGGVDSSVAALLLKKEGHDVIGMYMKNWDEPEGSCHATTDADDALLVCEQIGIPLYTVSFVKEYQTQVFSHFLSELKQGYTPNPDILCNREIKFKSLLNKALELGADYLATGHYAITDHKHLLKGSDPSKDQSYFLYTLNSSILSKVLFPLGNLHKSTIRQIAHKEGLPTAQKKDSTGICFIGKRNFKQFIHRYIPYTPGPFQTLSGKTIGEHSGTAFYTLGQRKGLGIGGPGDAWFVVKKDLKQNIIYVQQGTDHPSLYTQTLTATDPSWITTPPTIPFRCTAKVRYRQKDQPCTITSLQDNQLHVTFDEKQRAVTPRQSIVFYDGEVCLGGAFIE